MKAAILSLMIFGIVHFAFGQKKDGSKPQTIYNIQSVGEVINGDKITNIKKFYYRKVVTNLFINYEDKRLVALGFYVAITTLVNNPSAALKKTADSLLASCSISLNTVQAFKTEKDTINKKVNGIVRQQGESINQVKSAADNDFTNIRKTLLDNHMTAFRQSRDRDSVINALEFFASVIKDTPDSNFVRSYLPEIINNLPRKIKQAISAREINYLYSLDSVLCDKKLIPDEQATQRDIAESVADDLPAVKTFLGTMLLEGYKTYLIRQNGFHPKKDLSEIKALYMYVVWASEPVSLNFNMYLAQDYLFDHGFLKCEFKKTTAGWNWSERPETIQYLATESFASNLANLYLHVPSGEKLYSIANLDFETHKAAALAFYWKVTKFQRLTRNWPVEISQLLVDLNGASLQYNRCQTCSATFYILAGAFDKKQ